MRTYAVTGATGNTGNILAGRLLGEGHRVRAIGRDAGKLAMLVRKGAEAVAGSLDDERFLTEAFYGADAVYAMIPPNVRADDLRAYQNRVGETIAKAIESAGAKYVVNLSSLGAHLAEKTGPLAGLHDQEQRLNQLDGASVLHLRPTYFMENLFTTIGLIKNLGINGSPMRGDIEIPMIAIRDIGNYAAERLLKLDFSGCRTRELHGQRDLSLNEVTRVLGKAIGKPDLAYVQFPYEEAEKAMVSMGLSPSVARAYIEMSKAFNEGLVKGQETRSKENTTETSIEEFAKTFAAAYAA